MECTRKALTFQVSRKNPELITPAGPTPHDFKALSDIDDQDGHRLMQVPSISFYEGSPSMQGKDPVKIIRHAIAKALLFYYPFAGRLREIATRKLVVECTAEGVLFVEADANVTLQQFVQEGLHPPFPNMDQLLCDFPHSDGIIDRPLILFQVTRLKCGGFILAFRFTHVMSDGLGISRFIFAIGELARGHDVPSILPVWERHLLCARNPPCVSFAHPEYDLVPNFKIQPQNIDEHSFFFSAADISTLRCTLPPQLRNCSEFDIVSAFVWRCRTMALSLNPNEEVRLLFEASTNHVLNPPLPMGYYGNGIAHISAVATVEELAKGPLGYIVELVRKAKAKVTDKYMRSVANFLVVRNRPCFMLEKTFIVSDVRRLNFERVECGWGKAIYAGVGKSGPHPIHGAFSWFIPLKNNKGENGIVVPISLSSNVMEVFKEELNKMMDVARKATILNTSAL